MSEKIRKPDMPTTEQLQREVDRVHYRRDFSRVMVSTIYSLVVVAAVAVLVAVLLLPILRIYGHSMNDTLDEGDIVVSLKGSDFKTGDIIAFHYNNKILIKRVIGSAGDWVDIDADGNVYVNEVLVEEPYLDEKAFGECNIELPYQVPEYRSTHGTRRSDALRRNRSSGRSSIGCGRSRISAVCVEDSANRCRNTAVCTGTPTDHCGTSAVCAKAPADYCRPGSRTFSGCFTDALLHRGKKEKCFRGN